MLIPVIIYGVGFLCYLRYMTGRLAWSQSRIAGETPNYGPALLTAFFGAFVWPGAVIIGAVMLLFRHGPNLLVSETERKGLHAHQEQILDRLLEEDND